MSISREPVFLRRIFHPSDFSEASHAAFVHALKLAVAGQTHLTILHTGDTRTSGTWTEFPRVRRTLESWNLLPLGSTAQDIAGLGLDVEKVVLPYADPARSIVRYLHRHPHDLIVLATHHYDGLKRWVHDPVAEPISRESAEFTLFVPEGAAGFVSAGDGTTSLRNILIPVDAVPDPQASVNGALTIAETLGCRRAIATLLYVGEEEAFPRCSLPETHAIEWKKVSRKGPVEDEILHAAEQYAADLLVMSTQGHNGFLDVLRGSTTERILRRAKCPVLALPTYPAREPVVSTLEALATGKLHV